MPEQPQFIENLTDERANGASDGIPTHVALGIILGAAFALIVALRFAS